MPYKCTGAITCTDVDECPCAKPHEPSLLCNVLTGGQWVECKAGFSEANDGLVRCEKLTTKEELVGMILVWWEDNKFNTVSMGDGEEDNMYSEEPDFVTEARKLKEEVTE
jgi:hypothetical protein